MALNSSPCNKFSPRLEGLEAREVPAVQIFEVNYALLVFGDGHANDIEIRDNGKGTITVYAGSDHFTASGINSIDISTGGGKDSVNYQLTGPLKVTDNIRVWLGKGADEAHLNFVDGVAKGGHLSVTVNGGPGNDRESVTIGAIADGGSAYLTMDGGRGNDTLALNGKGKVAGKLVATLNSGTGHNTTKVVLHDTVTKTGHLTVKTS